MPAILKKHITSLSWCGIVILCLAVCFQLLGVPGTLFNFADSQDNLQASVLLGYTIVTGTANFRPWLISFFASTVTPPVYAFTLSFTLFHPPLFA